MRGVLLQTALVWLNTFELDKGTFQLQGQQLSIDSKLPWLVIMQPPCARWHRSVPVLVGRTAAMKTAYAEECHVVWPCEPTQDGMNRARRDGPLNDNPCEHLNLGPTACPRFWSQEVLHMATLMCSDVW